MKTYFSYAQFSRCFLGLLLTSLLSYRTVGQQNNPPQVKPYTEEWVYRVKYGFKDEWWKLFQKNQLSVLNRMQELGYVTHYTIYEPAFHISEESRWDFQLMIFFKSQEASTHASEIERQLFPDRDQFKKDENRRWELTTNHWDMPVNLVDPGKTY